MDNDFSFSPYQGLRPYTKRREQYFFGREIDSKNVTESALWHRLSSLYAETGGGKTSLIAAAVIGEVCSRIGRVPIYYAGPWQPGFYNKMVSEAAKDAGLRSAKNIEEMAVSWIENYQIPFIVIFDQVEEYFTYHQNTSDEEFEKQLARLVNRRDLDAHVLLSIRSDAFFELTRLEDRIPGITSNAIRLNPLDETAARDAILKPLERYNEQFREGLPPVEIEPDLVEVLLQQTQRPHPWVPAEAGNAQPRAIDTASLQLTLTKVWEADSAKWENVLGQTSLWLRCNTLNDLGGVNGISGNYVQNILETFTPDDKKLCAEMFGRMVTTSGRKFAMSASELAKETAWPEEQLTPLLETLCDRDRQLLRRTPDPRHAAEPLFEIFHDWLALPIRRWVDTIRERQRTAAAEARAAEETARADEIENLRRIAARTSVSLFVHLSKQSLKDGNARVAVLLALEATRYEIAAFPKLQDELCDRLRAALRYPIQIAYQDLEKRLRLADFSRDGKWLVTVCDDARKEIVIIELISNKYIEITGPVYEDAINGAVLSQDARVLVVTTDDGILGLWSFPDVKKITQPGDGEGNITAATVSNRGFIVTISAKRQCLVLQTLQGTHVSTAPFPESSDIIDFTCSPGGAAFALISSNGELRTFNIENGEWPHRFPPEESSSRTPISAVSFADDKRLVLGRSDGSVEIWNTSTSTLEKVRSYFNQRVEIMRIDPRRRLMCAIASGGSAFLADARTAEQLYPLATGAGNVCAAQFSADGQFLLTAARDGTIRRWDITSVIPVQVLEGHEKRVPAVAFSPDGRKTATGSADWTVRLWDAASGDLLQTIEGHGGPITAVQFDSGGTRLVTASWDRTARIWGVATGEALFELSGHTKPLTAAGFSPDGLMIVTASDDKTARLWDAVDGALIATLDGHEGPVYAVAFDPTGNRVLTASKDGTARLWQASARPSHRPFKVAECAVHAIAFSPDGQRFVAGQGDGIASLWDSERGECVHRLEGHTEAVRAVAFTPDGQVIVTAGLDGRVRFWDSATGEEMQTLQADSVQGQPVHAIALSPDGHAIVLGTAAGIAEVWRVNLLPLDLAGLVAYANGLNLRPLTDHEREEFGLEGRPAQDGEPAQPTAGDVPAPSAARD